MPGISGFIDGARATDHVRSPRCRAVGPGRIGPDVEVTAEDIGTVLRAAQTRRVVLFGASECGPACIKFAVDQPRVVAGLILFGSLAKGSWAPDFPHALRASQYDAWRQQLIARMGRSCRDRNFRAEPCARSAGEGLVGRAAARGLQSRRHLGRA